MTDQKAAPARPVTVPYIAAWSGEAVPSHPLMASVAVLGLAYVDEKPHDRAYGVLWHRRNNTPGAGRPLFGEVHSRRQLEAMRDLKCQVCGEPADEDRDGVLWLLEDERGRWPDWPNGLVTSHPPVCLPHAREAVTACPHLARGWVAVRVGESDPVAVRGRHYAVDNDHLLPLGLGNIRLDSPRIRWTIGGQLLRSLQQCSLVGARWPACEGQTNSG